MLFSHRVISGSPPLMAVAPSRGPPTPSTTTFARRLLQPTACNARLWAQLTAGLGVCVCGRGTSGTCSRPHPCNNLSAHQLKVYVLYSFQNASTPSNLL